MDKSQQLRSELIAHIQSEAQKAVGGDSSELISPEESSLFENRLRLFLKTGGSLYEEDMKKILHEIYSTTDKKSQFWNSELEVEEKTQEAKDNAENK